jgi:hypothetical protein
MKLKALCFIFTIILFLPSVLLTQTITILTPNGGEDFHPGDIEFIMWEWSGSIDSVKVEYSTNSGGYWTVIENKTLNDSICGWNIPNKPGNSYLVKVSDASNPSILDVSDNLFSVSSSINISSPSGGESWEVGSQQTITWDATNGISDVKIEYSTNGGANWTTLTNSTPNNGSFPWNIPNDPTTNNALVRVSDKDNSTVLNMSSPFSITTSLAVTSPNGGENWETGTIQDITWNASAGISEVKIELSTNGGGSWTNLETSTYNTGTYAWKIPNSPYNTCKIKISDYENSSVTDMSDGNFSIISQVDAIYPNGGEVFYVGEEQILQYSASSGISELDISYSTNNGSSWTALITVENDSSLIWNIPNTPSTQCLLKVTDDAVATVYDVSDDTFEINTGVKIYEEQIDEAIPEFFSQSQNIPNPFHRQTAIRYALPHDCRVTLKVYDIQGNLLRLLVDETQKAGYKIVKWNGTDNKYNKLPTGIYFYRIRAGSFSDTKKFILLN